MGSIQSDQQPPVQSSAQGYRSSFTANSTSRLRDSCHACASSKVKCTKEKPICSRCAKRATRCEYLVTKRPGRRHNSRASEGATDVSMTTITPNHGSMSSALPVWPEAFPTVSAADHAPSPSYSVQQSSPSTFPELVSEFDEFFNSPTFLLPDASNYELSGASNTSSGRDTASSSNASVHGKCHSNPVPPEDIIYLFGERSRSPSLPLDAISGKLPNNNRKSGGFTKDLENSHRCLPYALDTLKKLSAGIETACIMSLGEPSYSGSSSRYPSSVHAIISRNEQAIHDMSRILQCSCSAERFLLTIIALVVFKVLDWYANAAKTAAAGEDEILDCNPYSSLPSPSQRSAESIVSSFRQQKGRDFDRQSAQSVLVELHRVQRFLNQLSPKLQACGQEPQSRRTSTASSQPSMTNSHFSEDFLTMISSPFPLVVLEQLDLELRKRLRSLSGEIIEFLRRD